MRFVSSLCWVAEGKSITPTNLKLDRNEMKQIFSEKKVVSDDDDDEDNENKASDSNEEDENLNDDEKIDKKYNLDDYDDEDNDIRLDHLKSLACFSNNHDDDLLTLKDEGDDSDLEDFELKKTDNLLVAGHFDEDICSLNVYVYNSTEGDFYIHHDLMLPSYPICLEWLDYDPTDEKGSVNYLAVGSLNPWIEIWDLDIVDSLEPEFILGSQKKIKPKKDGVKKQKIAGHRDAVLDLSWNTLNKTVLASGSVDKSIILWDLQKLKMATRIKNHSKKVQTVKFHPIEVFSLLSGSADKTVALYDCRNPNSNKKIWNLNGKIEQVVWNHLNPNYFLCCDDNGTVNMIDIRNSEPVITLQAHEESVNSITLSSTVPNLFLTASEDECVKIWDIKETSIDLVHEKKFKIGGINTIKASPNSGFVYSVGGGNESEPKVWDIQEIPEVRETFYPRMGIKEIVKTEEELKEEKKNDKRTKRSKRFLKSDKFETKRKKHYEKVEIEKCVKKKLKQ